MYNPHFVGNFHRNGSTFPNMLVPPPPFPPPFFAPPPPPLSDEEFVKSFENKIKIKEKVQKDNVVSISNAQRHFKSIVMSMNTLKNKEDALKNNIETMDDIEWNSSVIEIENIKNNVDASLAIVDDNYLESLRKILRKRLTKRSRLKRLQLEKRKEKEDKRLELAERSRKIDEKLQKIRNEWLKIEQEEKAKLEADIVLRDVSKQKSDAKKSLKKLEALVKLYKARQNLARGRGENIPECNTLAFNSNIENLKSLWTRKLSIYEEEEKSLLKTLEHNNQKTKSQTSTEQEKDVLINLKKWREFLFGDSNAVPQRNFEGNLQSFIAVRSLWDQYISDTGTALPVGWVVPDA